MNQPSSGNDFLGFGEFGGRTYEDVQEMEPHYCLWVRETINTSESSEDTQRFGRWLECQRKPMEEHHVGNDGANQSENRDDRSDLGSVELVDPPELKDSEP